MIKAFLVLLLFELAGEAVQHLTRMPIPGAVIGMVLLAAALFVTGGPRGGAGEPASTSDLDTVAGGLIRNMGLLFVPAGVGVITEAHLLEAQWLPILAGLLGSTILGLCVTSLVMHLAVRSDGADAAIAGASNVESLNP
jgi:putative effector of murein hydrolase LrgA (UPF0299 family)